MKCSNCGRYISSYPCPYCGCSGETLADFICDGIAKHPLLVLGCLAVVLLLFLLYYVVIVVFSVVTIVVSCAVCFGVLVGGIIGIFCYFKSVKENLFGNSCDCNTAEKIVAIITIICVLSVVVWLGFMVCSPIISELMAGVSV